MTSVAFAALAAPAFAGPDRFEGASCSAMAGAARTDCIQQQMLGDVGNRHFSKTVNGGAIGSGLNGSTAAPANVSISGAGAGLPAAQRS
ncbi:MAG TPA: hypothetical protein VH934_01885, partial [Xanthobacteraceae bacterium]